VRFAVKIENGLRTKWTVSDKKNEFKTKKQQRKNKLRHKRIKTKRKENDEEEANSNAVELRAAIIVVAREQSNSTMTLFERSHVVRAVTAHHGHVTSANHASECTRKLPQTPAKIPAVQHTHNEFLLVRGNARKHACLFNKNAHEMRSQAVLVPLQRSQS
jgi:hypothetical protein